MIKFFLHVLSQYSGELLSKFAAKVLIDVGLTEGYHFWETLPFNL